MARARGHEHWSPEAYLLAGLVDLTAGANWQRGGKGRKPKPMDRPKPTSNTRSAARMTRDEVDAELAKRYARHAEIETTNGA